MTVQRNIETKIRSSLAPSHLEVIDESHMHSVPPGSESHFRVVVVSERFEDLPLVQRHRAARPWPLRPAWAAARRTSSRRLKSIFGPVVSENLDSGDWHAGRG
jgi:acid stress-induced BolA-like protein IbaG/YrbA